MATRTSLNAVSAATLLCASVIFLSCGGNGDKLTPQPDAPSSNGIVTAPSAMGPAPTVTDSDIAAAREELSSMSVPVGIERDDWLALGEALIASMEERADRSASKLPDEERNMIDDLTWVDKGGGDFDLTWTLKNAGDYDSNGEVNVADLTPIGMHLGKNEGSSDWASAQAADGDGNGEVNIADVSPIGSNFQSQVLGYNVYSSQFETGPWLLKGSLEIGDASSGFPRLFTYPYGAQDAFVTVSPFDASGVDNVQLSGGTAAKYIPGETTENDSQTLDSAGGTLIGSGVLEGITVEIPTGALEVAEQITLSSNDGMVLPVVGTWSGVIIELSGEDPTDYQEPVEIIAPFSGDPDVIPVPYYIRDDGKLEACMLAEIDYETGDFSFFTTHNSSIFTWIVDEIVNAKDEYRLEGFRPEMNGFQIEDIGFTNSAWSESLGMAAFAQWYYRFAGRTPLYPRFMDKELGQRNEDIALFGQHIIATRAHDSMISSSVHWNYDNFEESDLVRIVSRMENYNVFDMNREVRLIKNDLHNVSAPVLVYLTNENSLLHTVLAIGYTEDSLLIYDPDYPAELKEIFLNQSSINYPGTEWSQIWHLGVGTYPREDFGRILDDAETDFNGSADAFIENLNYMDHDVIEENMVTLTGKVSSGLLLVERLRVYLNSKQYSTPVDLVSGAFSIELPIRNGDNYLVFRTEGGNDFNFWKETPNNFTNGPGLHLVGDYELDLLRVTLTWDQNNSFGMFVEDPSGQWDPGTRIGNQDMSLVTDAGGYYEGSYEDGGPTTLHHSG